MNSKFPVAWLLVSAVLFPACASAEVTTNEDASTGDFIVTHKSDFVSDVDGDGLSLSGLMASKIIKADGSVAYLLVVSTNAARVPDDAGGFRPVPEDRAVWMIDGQATRLGSAIANSEVQGEFVRRFFYVHLGAQEFARLANASRAELVVGEQRYAISSNALAEIKEVLEYERS